VYTSRPGEWKPELGDYLGDLTNEVPDNRIIEFVTGGPKNYITGEMTFLKSVRSRVVVLHDDSFVEDYPVVFVLIQTYK
jgi:hypothetical protein